MGVLSFVVENVMRNGQKRCNLKLGFISDTHHEFSNRNIGVPSDVDVLVLAGDIHVRPKMLKQVLLDLRKQTSAHIVYVLGNHEYYGHVFPDILDNYAAQAAKVEGVSLLEKDSIVINEVKFLGCTLWSDLSDPIAALAVEQALFDFRKIHVTRGSDRDRFRAIDCNKEFNKSRDWLSAELKKDDGPTVVVTHHSPSPITCARDYKYSPIRNAFNSDMDELIINYGPDVWIYGHDHVKGDHKIGKTRLLSNPAGYPHENISTAISIIEVL